MIAAVPLHSKKPKQSHQSMSVQHAVLTRLRSALAAQATAPLR
jgi:hypothetical protein